MKRITIIILMALTISGFTYSQNKKMQDTLFFQMPNQTTIEYITSYNIKRNNVTNINIKEKLDDFLIKWKTIGNNQIPKNKSIAIICSDETKDKWSDEKIATNMVIKEINEENKFKFPESKSIVLDLTAKNKLIFKTKNYTLNIYFNTLNQITELTKYNWNDILKNIDNEINNKNTSKTNFKYVAYSMWFNIKRDNVNLIHKEEISPDLTTMLSITGSPNLGFVKNKWYTSLNLRVLFEYYKRNESKYKIGLNYEWMFHFYNNQRYINQWLDASVGAKLNALGSDLTSISFGFLIKKEGDLFKKNTMRIGFENQINRHISVTPQIYFNDFFKNIYPGVKIGFSF